MNVKGESKGWDFVGVENMNKNIGGVKFNCNNAIIKGILYQPNDILLSNIRPYLKKIWYANKNGCCSQDVLNIRIIESNKVDSKYLFYYLSHDIFFEYIMGGSKGTKMPRGDKKQIMKYCLFAPYIVEQQKIATFLTLIDKRIETQMKIIEEYKSLMNSIVIRIFGDKSKFSNKWKKTKLSEILTERKLYAQKDSEFARVTLSKDGIIDKTDRYNRDFLVKDEEKEYKITKLNDICYNPANLKFGVICLNK